MKTSLTVLTLAVLLTPAGCASSPNSSEAEWQRGQCMQINDEKAREKCMKRVEDEFGRRR
jgi:hypothetical protein